MALRSVKNKQSRRKFEATVGVVGDRGVNRFDQWLTRFSYVAQIAGVALALFGLFYTVIPLYQKAAVDEQLARREAELKEVESRLVAARQEAYESRRERRMLGLLFASDDCAELRKAIGQAALEDSKERRREIILNFEVDIRACLLGKIAELRNEKILTEEDIAVLENNARGLGQELMRERADLAVRISDLPKTARKDASLLAPRGDMVRRADDFIDRADALLPPHLRRDRTEERLISQIEWTQEQMAQEFRLSASKRIRQHLVPKEWRAVKVSNDKRVAS